MQYPKKKRAKAAEKLSRHSPEALKSCIDASEKIPNNKTARETPKSPQKPSRARSGRLPDCHAKPYSVHIMVRAGPAAVGARHCRADALVVRAQAESYAFMLTLDVRRS